MININLLPKKDRERNLIPLLILFFIISWFLLISLLVYQNLIVQQKIVQEEINVEKILSEQKELNHVLNELNAIKLAEQEIDKKDILDVLYYFRVFAPNILLNINSSLPSDGNVRSVYFSFPSELSIISELESLSNAADYLVNLRKLPFVNQADLQVISKEENKYYSIHYVIDLKKEE
ncbi:PilN domain-containing protein [Chengkuizengella sp. SCS-71B]|uniref:PilN domain-containing protein n=1 Tax=Chengkuizengella sp. SCS-71B TaxID=3115290 RepID=UPI0032C22303